MIRPNSIVEADAFWFREARRAELAAAERRAYRVRLARRRARALLVRAAGLSGTALALGVALASVLA